MATKPVLQPTLWRTCRVLANRTRLQIFRCLLQQPGQSVSAIAERLNLPLPVTSQSLRALEARGLLTVRRVGRRVLYRPAIVLPEDAACGLVAAIRQTFQRDPQPAETLFKLATAFTHPRRIEIFRTLQRGPQTFGELQVASGVSARALLRHLGKLKTREFVAGRSGRYAVATVGKPFGQALARLANAQY